MEKETQQKEEVLGSLVALREETVIIRVFHNCTFSKKERKKVRISAHPSRVPAYKPDPKGFFLL